MNTVLVCKSNLLPYSETFILEQAKALREWRPVLVGWYRVERGLDLSGFDLTLLEAPFYRRALGAFLSGSWKRAGGASARVLQAFRSKEPALLHVHFGPEALVFAPLARALEVPMVVSLHGFDVGINRKNWEAGIRGSRMRRYPRALLRLTEETDVLFIAASRQIMECALDFGIPQHRVVVHHIGVDSRSFSLSPIPLMQRDKIILFVGRLEEKKGCAVLLDAFSRISARHPEAEVMVMGDGSLRPLLEKQAEALGISARVRFLGACPKATIQQQMHRARVCCVPSVVSGSGDREALPIVILEAQASGVPVVTSAHNGDLACIRNGITGLAFDEGDASTLAGHLDKLLGDDALATRMLLSARELVEREFDIGDLTQNLECLYDRVTAQRRAGTLHQYSVASE